MLALWKIEDMVMMESISLKKIICTDAQRAQDVYELDLFED